MYNTILALILAHSAPGAVPAKKLTAEIIYLSALHKTDPVTVAKIIMTESNGLEHAYNTTSQDFGLGQINVVTAQHLGIKSDCLFNWRCNLKHAVRIISKQHRVCAYNLGRNGARNPKKSFLCLRYETKVASIK